MTASTNTLKSKIRGFRFMSLFSIYTEKHVLKIYARTTGWVVQKFPSYVLSAFIRTSLEKFSNVPAIDPDSSSCLKSSLKFSTLYYSPCISVERILK